MKKTVLFLTFLLCWQLNAQNTLTSENWKTDLRFLQKTVHEEYPFLFKKITAEDFDAAVEKFHDAIPNMQDHEILVGFAKIIALFKYGHTRVGFRDGPVPYHQLPIYTREFPEGTYITGTHEDYGTLVGAKILAVENKPMADVLKAIYPVVPAENDQFFKAYGGLYLVIPEVLHAQGITETLQQEIDFSLEKDGKTFSATILAKEAGDIPMAYGEVKPGTNWVSVRDLESNPLYLKDLDKIYYYEYLPQEKALYVRHSQIQDDPSEDIPTFYKRVFDFVENNEVEKLIIDVRLNGGGNNYKNKPIITGTIEQQKINQKGKLFVIIGRRTFSACQNLVNEFSNYTNAIFVGEPTAENINFYGDNRRVDLPNSKLPMYLSFAWWQDKPQWENGPYTAPHLAVEMGFDDYRSNRDPVLEKALGFNSADFIIDPMAYLRGLFMENKLDLLRTEAMRLVKDPQYRFVKFEDEFNKAGYNLLDSKQIEGAIFVLQANTELFPESANTWDSLAEAYWKAGDAIKAREYYQKAIDLDPQGPIGDNARNMLKKMDKK